MSIKGGTVFLGVLVKSFMETGFSCSHYSDTLHQFCVLEHQIARPKLRVIETTKYYLGQNYSPHVNIVKKKPMRAILNN